ncbi:MAG: hypothetical protein QOE46_965 [Acidobacteriota bacterium]|jgi:hypothetical protein|nr:hypothetical protein [Acidobacteriota bacterium]
MTDWMRRRIERSRARCEKAATNHKPGKAQEANPRPNADADTALSFTQTANTPVK